MEKKKGRKKNRKLKLLALGIDAMDPKILFDKINKFPIMKKLYKTGVHGMLDCYCYGYGSSDNWATIYTGLAPTQHGIIKNRNEDGNVPTIHDVKNKNPFWEVLNKNGFSVGMIRGLMTNPPAPIDGYMLGGDPEFMFKPTCTKYPLLNKKDAHLGRLLKGKIIKFKRTKLIEELGSTWEEVEKTQGLINKILPSNYYAEFLKYMKSECDYYANNIPRLFKQQPTDMIFFYLSSIDTLQHFQWHEPGWKTIIKGYKIIDEMIGNLLKELEPENVIVFSDHGQEPFHMLFPRTPRGVQEKAFEWKPRAWMKNGVIVGKGAGDGVLTGAHSLKGVIIADGEIFLKNKIINDYRIIDFYPTLLAFFNIEAPQDREGVVMPVFKDKKKNKKKKSFELKKIVVFQTAEVYKILNRVNELFLKHRGCEITIIGRKEYKNIFLYDPRIKNFISAKKMSLDSMNKRRKLRGKDMISGFSGILKEADIIVLPYIVNGETHEFRIEK